MIDYNKTQPVLEMYRATQTEGSLAGRPHIIVRTTGCTHRCYFGEGGWCDSWYTSIHPEKGKFTLQDIKQFFADNWDINHLMITGGSPSMHPDLVNELVTMFKHLHSSTKGIVTIETEGSHMLHTDKPIDVISLSPKFSNSVPVIGVETPQGKITDQKMIDQHNKFRMKYDVICQLLAYHKDYHFKPVWDGTEELMQEIESFRKRFNIPKDKTWIMPAGDTREELLKMYPIVLDYCTTNAYNFSGRDHILAYGDKREV
jgi:7-carboxy-7-deazaguanine synthase